MVAYADTAFKPVPKGLMPPLPVTDQEAGIPYVGERFVRALATTHRLVNLIKQAVRADHSPSSGYVYTAQGSPSPAEILHVGQVDNVTACEVALVLEQGMEQYMARVCGSFNAVETRKRARMSAHASSGLRVWPTVAAWQPTALGKHCNNARQRKLQSRKYLSSEEVPVSVAICMLVGTRHMTKRHIKTRPTQKKPISADVHTFHFLSD